MWRLKVCRRMMRDENGAVAVLMVALLPALVAFAALAVDMSYAYWTRTQLQHAASAAALAGIYELVDEAGPLGEPDTGEYRRKAIEYAYKNMPALRHGDIVVQTCGSYDPVTNTVSADAECADVKAGDWDAETRTFTPWDDGFDPATMELDAIRVVTRRSEANGNPLRLFLAAAVGLAETDINTSAIAWAMGGGENDCFQSGLLAGNELDIQSNDNFVQETCLYGAMGISIQSNNDLDDTSDLAIGPGGGLEQGNNNRGFPTNEDEVDRLNLEPLLVLQWQNTWLGELETALSPPGAYLPSFVNVDFLPDSLTVYQAFDDVTFEADQGEWIDFGYDLYVIDGKAVIDANARDVAIVANEIAVSSQVTLDNVILLANEKISVGSAYRIDRAVLVARKNVELASNGIMGGPDCDEDGATTIQIFAVEDVSIASNTTVSNADIAAGHDVKVASNVDGNGATMQALNDIWVASNVTFRGCDEGGGGGTGPLAGVTFRLVE